MRRAQGGNGMRFVMRSLGLLAGLLFLVVALELIASESGEVVVVTTTDESNQPHETRLWVVDEGGKQWVRAGDPNSGWLLNIQQNPAVEVERDGQRAAYAAVPNPALRDQINPLFAEKYGWADSYIAALFGRDDATPIRLDPR
jgi:hypothetical protein